MEFFEEWFKTSKDERNSALLNFVATKHDLGSISEQSLKNIKAAIARFSAKISEKWQNSRRMRDRFLSSNKSWLEGDITFHTLDDIAEPSTSSQQPMAGPGRPKVDLQDAASKTKRRRVDDLIQSRSSEELLTDSVTLIKKFGVILRTLSSGFDINLEKFRNFAQETRLLYINLYSWYYMPATVHKILVHGADVIQSSLLPIGQLSEESQEARNKDCRRFRQHNTRKQSRIATNTDLLNMLIITSDPVINSLREIPKKKTGSLPSEVLDLILEPKTINRSLVDTTSVVSHNEYTEEDSSEEELSDDDE